MTSFTHVDPFEDTERLMACLTAITGETCFTHVDPFEDTESLLLLLLLVVLVVVSPTSIRSRILKGACFSLLRCSPT